MSANKIPIQFLIISDTHDLDFENATGPFRKPVPKVDVVLHCGDMTTTGGTQSYRNCVEMLGNLDAELKLVIAGNHDLDLDKPFFNAYFGTDGDEPQEYDRAIDAMTGDAAKTAGVTYLEEGIHTFTLKSGATFKIYASPYSAAFGRATDWGFQYERNHDRFNPPDQVASGMKPIAKNPIPTFGANGVDIIMTHGPPKSILDKTYSGENAGCENILRAVSRARPLMCCFGHIHEGNGAKIVTWEDDQGVFGWEAIERQGATFEKNYPEHNHVELEAGKETLMVNSAIMDIEYKATNAPWVVDLHLPVAK